MNRTDHTSRRRFPAGAAAALALALSLASCATLRVERPEGFAVFREPSSSDRVFSAVTPEGMKYRVRIAANYPEQELSFWSDALAAQLKTEGYTRLGEPERFTSGGREGAAFEWGVPYGEENYIYLTAILVDGKEILIAEAAAEASVYERYRGSLLESVKSITVE